jgi:tetratricopeptide (TPR) repeat protein
VALHHAEKAVRLDPLAAPINVALAGALADNGRMQEALARYRKVLEIDPRMSNAYRNIANLQQTVFARPDEAIATLRELERVDPGNPHLVDRAMNYGDLGDEDTARKVLLRAAANGEFGAEAVLAALSSGYGDWVESRRHAEQALARNPGFPLAHRVLRNVDIHEGRTAAALARYAARWPALLSEEQPRVDAANWIVALDLVPLLQAAGETLQATRLLDACERFIGARTRLGPAGYGIADVQINALRGDNRAALHALREARKAGWSAGWRYFLIVEPSLAAIRQEPEFQAMYAELEAHMAALRAKMPAYPEDE